MPGTPVQTPQPEEEIYSQQQERERRLEELEKQAEELEKQAEEREKQAEEQARATTFSEFIQHCHELLSEPLKFNAPYKCTTESIPVPKAKYCPTTLRPLTAYDSHQQSIYDRVYNYLQPTEKNQMRLFTSLHALQYLSRRYFSQALCSERGFEMYERMAVEDHTQDIISELCKVPAAKAEFSLGDGIQFDTHTNSLSQVSIETEDLPHPRPDQFCMHRVDGTLNSLLLVVEYKPPHKLPLETLRIGLRPMQLWEEMVHCDIIPTDHTKKLQYNAEQLVTSAITQTYDVMIQEGCAHGILTNGLARVLLHIPYDDPTTLLYHLCEPNNEIKRDDKLAFQESKTSLARVLCHSLSAFHYPIREQKWRNLARSKLHTWKTSFDYTRYLIPRDELLQTPPPRESTSSEYLPSSCLPNKEEGPQMPTGFQGNSAPSTPRQLDFCTQRCLLGLRTHPHTLDASCPNIEHHRQGQVDLTKHSVTSEDMLRELKDELDNDIDRCIPLGSRGSYGAPFKLTCSKYGYTVLGKGTTSSLWKEVSKEKDVYHILRAAQGSAVPVFWGAIDLENIFFLHNAGPICHMLIMGWAGENTAKMEITPSLRREIKRSNKEIEALRIIHKDLRCENILWNEELGRAMIIDFHRSALRPAHHRPTNKRKRPLPEM
ncbi:hypothetical protein N7456_010887 [Penicillium angulare]|uniref:Protein kinase domain-containing protein n=1 Tax=Penicillium angulare TaxID=116970 RepID=A0A9W9JZP1_9EURO|nr:hypothetical protein N7456_010887 [Penicillium angulare]